MDGEELAALIGAGDHLLKVGGADGDGLLADNIFAGSESRHDYLFMVIVGRCDGDKVDTLVGEQLLTACESVNAVLLGDLIPCRVDVIYADKLGILAHLVLHLAGMPAAHAAVTDDGKSEFSVNHSIASLFRFVKNLIKTTAALAAAETSRNTPACASAAMPYCASPDTAGNILNENDR